MDFITLLLIPLLCMQKCHHFFSLSLLIFFLIFEEEISTPFIMRNKHSNWNQHLGYL